MKIKHSKLHLKKYPQNYVIRNPYMGTAIVFLLSFFFILIYKPFNVHPAQTFSFELTMAIYCIAMTIPVFLITQIIKRFEYFNINNWTILKESISLLIVLIGMGLFVYLTGFVIEAQADRLNLRTFFNSLFTGFLIGLIPFLFFTLINYRYLFVTEISQDFAPLSDKRDAEYYEKEILIPSQLKKEELSFHPSALIYAESEGNYVVFYLMIEGKLQKKMVRNSMNNIEQHLSGISSLMRIHRAFMVNLKYIQSVKGNTLGYRVKLHGIEIEIPVSRQNSKTFIQNVKLFQ
jgi:hypothetical protein